MQKRGETTIRELEWLCEFTPPRARPQTLYRLWTASACSPSATSTSRWSRTSRLPDAQRRRGLGLRGQPRNDPRPRGGAPGVSGRQGPGEIRRHPGTPPPTYAPPETRVPPSYRRWEQLRQPRREDSACAAASRRPGPIGSVFLVSTSPTRPGLTPIKQGLHNRHLVGLMAANTFLGVTGS